MVTALIVEDEPDANHLLCLLVKTLGYEAISASTGAQALSLLRDHRPDVILLDLMLPDLDGFTISRAIKSDSANALVPIVIVTARMLPDCEESSYEAGASFFIQKPYHPEQIFGTLRAAEQWRQQALCLPAEGRFPADPDQIPVCRREFGRMASLIRAYCPSDDGDVDALLTALHFILNQALLWGRERSIRPVAEFRYRVTADSLTIQTFDSSGWLKDDPVPLEGLLSWSHDGAFEVLANVDGADLTLIRRVRPLMADPA